MYVLIFVSINFRKLLEMHSGKIFADFNFRGSEMSDLQFFYLAYIAVRERLSGASYITVLREVQLTGVCAHEINFREINSHVINYRVFNFADNQFLVDQLFITPSPVTSTQLLKSTQYYKAF